MKIYVAFLLAFTNSVFSADFDVDRYMLKNGLSLFPLEKLEDRQYFRNLRYVRVENGQLLISNRGKNSNRITYKKSGLHYKGTNNGEFGGSLEVTKDGVTEELMKGNIVHLLPIENQLYVIEGLSHLTMNGGSINVIPNRKEPTKPQRITLIPDAPILVYVDKTRPDYQPIIIVGQNSVVALSPFEQLEILYWKAFWSYKLSPTSIARYGDYYFIGLPGGVAVLPATLEPQEIRFYTDNEFNKPK